MSKYEDTQARERLSKTEVQIGIILDFITESKKDEIETRKFWRNTFTKLFLVIIGAILAYYLSKR